MHPVVVDGALSLRERATPTLIVVYCLASNDDVDDDVLTKGPIENKKEKQNGGQ